MVFGEYYDETSITGEFNSGYGCKVNDGGFVPIPRQVDDLIKAGYSLKELNQSRPYDPVPKYGEALDPAMSKDFDVYNNAHMKAMDDFVTSQNNARMSDEKAVAEKAAAEKAAADEAQYQAYKKRMTEEAAAVKE